MIRTDHFQFQVIVIPSYEDLVGNIAVRVLFKPSDLYFLCRGRDSILIKPYFAIFQITVSLYCLFIVMNPLIIGIKQNQSRRTEWMIAVSTAVTVKGDPGDILVDWDSVRDLITVLAAEKLRFNLRILLH